MGIERLDETVVRPLVRAALDEDRAMRDATARVLFASPVGVTAEIRSTGAGILAGLDVARRTFLEMDPACTFEALLEDGASLREGSAVARVSGEAGKILAAERTALNFLQRLSGVATLTRRYVQRIAGSGARILDTRKTTPLLRELEKYAVRVGGGFNHRRNLEEMILVKENHIRALGGIGAVLDALEKARPSERIEVEVDSLKMLNLVLGRRINRIMLDNFSPENVKKALAMIERRWARDSSGRPEVEVSGGISLENIERYAIPGVDFISVGAITHSARSVDMSMEVVEVG